jgi:predicted DCC family thiol-disulfide oxidoreductase YuxK
MDINSSVLIYDGDCGFCNASLLWGYRHLAEMPAAIPYQQTDLDKYGLLLEEVEKAVYLVSSDIKFSGHAAVAQLFLWQSSRRYRLLGRLMMLPLLQPIMKFGYRLVAENRRFLPGATEACGVRKAQSNKQS